MRKVRMRMATPGFARRCGVWVCAFGLAWTTAACGGEEKKKTLWPGGDPAPAKKEEAKAATVDDASVLGENPKWKPIAPLFETYAKQTIAGIANPMLPGLALFVEKPLAQEPFDPGAAGPESAGAEPQGEATPLTVASLDKYRLIILVTGVAQPKAVVLDPDGHKWTVVRGDALGKEGGRVEAILEFKMLVSVPGQAKAVEVSIAPPMSELDSEAGREDSGL